MAKKRVRENQGCLIPDEPVTEQDKINGSIVRNLQETLENEEVFYLFPTWLAKVLQNDLWQRFAMPISGTLFRWDDFENFVTTRRPRGLGVEGGTQRLYAECRFLKDQGQEDAARALELLRKMMPEAADPEGGAPIGNKNAAKTEHKNNTDNIRVVSKYGTSENHLLRRLKRDRPDLAEKVIAGELKAYAAAIEAGILRRVIQVDANAPERTAATIRRRCSQDFVEKLKALL